MATANGRPRDSCVWKYFKYLAEENKSVCLVTVRDDQQCGHSITGFSVHGLSQVVFAMLRGLEQRFEYITNLKSDFDPLYVTLNPGYREILTDEQVAAAKSQFD